jgi:hypothetical protein
VIGSGHDVEVNEEGSLDMTNPNRSSRVQYSTQGEALATWGLWSLLIVVMFVTYARLDPVELHHVTGDGIAGGLSRVLVSVNFPIAIIAIALVLVAVARLPKWGWWIGAPAIVLCAITAVPGVVDDQDLDARWINVVPALGVALAAGLTVLAARHADRSPVFTARLPLDPLRWGLAAVATVLSVPWILAELGVYGPGWVFIMERPITGSDGVVNPAVHLGHHHGFDGALFVVSAALLSRVRVRSPRLRTVTVFYLSLVFAYGAVHLVQDAWNEQLAKRGWVDTTIPSALNPALEVIWLVILAVTAVTAAALHRESTGVHDQAAPVTEGPTGGIRNGTC